MLLQGFFHPFPTMGLVNTIASGFPRLPAGLSEGRGKSKILNVETCCRGREPVMAIETEPFSRSRSKKLRRGCCHSIGTARLNTSNLRAPPLRHQLLAQGQLECTAARHRQSFLQNGREGRLDPFPEAAGLLCIIQQLIPLTKQQK